MNNNEKPNFMMGFVEYLYNKKFNGSLSFLQLRWFYFFATLIPLIVMQANGIINWLWAFIFVVAYISQYIFLFDYIVFSGGTILYYGQLLCFLLKISNLTSLDWLDCFVYPFFGMWVYYIIMFIWYTFLILAAKLMAYIIVKKFEKITNQKNDKMDKK